MTDRQHKIFIITGMLVLLTVSAFYLHVRAYRTSSTRTIDELVFYHLGAQLKDHFPEYHTQRFADLLLHLRPQFAPLPSYFYEPVFKHPPLFAALISLALRIFGDNYISALYVSAFFGACTIFLVFWLGALVFDETVGLLSAFVLWLDPVNIIPAQKIWADTTVTFFMTLAACLFLSGLKSRKNFYWPGLGLTVGLAALTKYPGILAWMSVSAYCLLFARERFRDKVFLLSLALPFLMLLPWAAWTLLCSGPGFWNRFMTVNELSRLEGPGTLALVVSCGLAALILVYRRKFFSALDWFMAFYKKILPENKAAAALGLFILLVVIRRAFDFTLIPATTWIGAQFKHSSRLFYIQQLSGFSLVYALALVSLFLPCRNRNIPGCRFLKLSTVLMGLFFLIWGNYQCRYILPLTPALIVLGAALWVRWFRFGAGQENKKIKYTAVISASALGAFALLKMFYIDLIVSFANNMCYY